MNFSFDLSGQLDNIEKGLLRAAYTVGFGVVFYSVVSIVISGMIQDKQNETQLLIADVNSQITAVESDTNELNAKINEYTNMLNRLDAINAQMAEKNSKKNMIPNLLVRIMSSIPKSVQVLKIQNTQEKHVTITAQSADYADLGFFLATLKNEETLLNVKSNSGVNQNNMVTITIEGDMP